MRCDGAGREAQAGRSAGQTGLEAGPGEIAARVEKDRICACGVEVSGNAHALDGVLLAAALLLRQSRGLRIHVLHR